MPENWAIKYIDVYRERQREKREARERLQLAAAGAPDMFQRIKNRIQQDLQILHNAGVLQSVQFNDISQESFSVNDTAPTMLPARPTLAVDLESILVKYWYRCPPQERGKAPYQDTGTLRICSDLNGVMQAYRNGNEKAFADVAEVSEFLLRPLLDFVGG